MAFAGKVAELNPSATTATKLYTCPASTVFVGHVVAANRSVTDTTIRVSIRIAGAGADDKQFMAYDLPLPGNDAFQTSKIALAATDEVWVYTTDATVSFVLTGLEFS